MVLEGPGDTTNQKQGLRLGGGAIASLVGVGLLPRGWSEDPGPPALCRGAAPKKDDCDGKEVEAAREVGG
jgi:hypothetical protein